MWYISQMRCCIRSLNSSIGGRLAEIVSVAQTSVVVILSRGRPREWITSSIFKLSFPQEIRAICCLSIIIGRSP